MISVFMSDVEAYMTSSFLSVPPSFQRNGVMSAGEVKDVILNNPISLYCETNAMPPPTLTWYKDGQPLTSGSRVHILPGEYTIHSG